MQLAVGLWEVFLSSASQMILTDARYGSEFVNANRSHLYLKFTGASATGEVISSHND
jgi:hypothetical protein